MVSAKFHFYACDITFLFSLGAWITNLKGMPFASQETCAALELYHSQLKIRLLNEKDPDAYQRVDWLVDKLGTKVQAYFWLDEYSGKDDFSRYWKDEWASGLTAWRKSLMIPDTDVIIDGKHVKVIDQNDRDLFHVVWNPGTEYAICSCSWAEKGNLCEHVFKVIKLFRKKGTVLPSISLVQYDQCLINMLECPPHDSFIRDHAVALTVWVCEQLNAQIGQESTQEVTKPVEQHQQVFDNGLLSLSTDSHMVDESHVSIEKNSSNQSVQVEFDKNLSAVSMDPHMSEDLDAILENESSIPSVSVEFDNAVPIPIHS